MEPSKNQMKNQNEMVVTTIYKLTYEGKFMVINCPPRTLQIFSRCFMCPRLSPLAFEQKSYFQKQLRSCFQKLCDV